MLARVLLMCAGLTILQSAAFGEEPTPASDLEQIRADLTQFKSDVNDKFGEISEQLKSLGAVSPYKASTLEQRVARLEEQQEIASTNIRDQGAAIGQIAERDEAGKYYWKFNANSQPAKQQFDRAIKATAPEFGTLIINNRMSTGQWIIINGKQEYVNAGAYAEFPVKPGNATTQLPGQRPISWAVTLPNYSQSIDIKPAPSWPVEQRVVYTYPTYVSWDSGY